MTFCLYDFRSGNLLFCRLIRKHFMAGLAEPIFRRAVFRTGRRFFFYQLQIVSGRIQRQFFSGNVTSFTMERFLARLCTGRLFVYRHILIPFMPAVIVFTNICKHLCRCPGLYLFCSQLFIRRCCQFRILLLIKGISRQCLISGLRSNKSANGISRFYAYFSCCMAVCNADSFAVSIDCSCKAACLWSPAVNCTFHIPESHTVFDLDALFHIPRKTAGVPVACRNLAESCTCICLTFKKQNPRKATDAPGPIDRSFCRAIPIGSAKIFSDKAAAYTVTFDLHIRRTILISSIAVISHKASGTCRAALHRSGHLTIGHGNRHTVSLCCRSDQDPGRLLAVRITFCLHIPVGHRQIFQFPPCKVSKQAGTVFFLTFIYIKSCDGFVVSVKISAKRMKTFRAVSASDRDPTMSTQINVRCQYKMLIGMTFGHHTRIDIRCQLRQLLRRCDLPRICRRSASARKRRRRII